ncbi:type VII secretion target [Salinifilum ghardaiensis]
MTDSGTGFAVDLYRLEKVAKDRLPTVSTVYGRAVGMCQDAESALSGISDVPEQFHGAGGSVSHAYGQLHSAIVDVLKSTRTSLDDTADALHEAVQMYADTDQGISEELDQLMQQRGAPKPEGN